MAKKNWYHSSHESGEKFSSKLPVIFGDISILHGICCYSENARSHRIGGGSGSTFVVDYSFLLFFNNYISVNVPFLWDRSFSSTIGADSYALRGDRHFLSFPWSYTPRDEHPVDRLQSES